MLALLALALVITPIALEARVAPKTLKVTANPANMASAAGAVWVCSNSGDAILRIDPATNGFTAIHLGQDGPASITAAGGTLSRIDPASNTVVETLSGFGNPLIVRSWLGDLWVGDNKGSLRCRLHITH